MAGPINNNINLPGSLITARAASAAKGSEVTNDNSKDKKEEGRELGQLLKQAKNLLNLKKASTPNKGTLA
jgi:hypothetical protein